MMVWEGIVYFNKFFFSNIHVVAYVISNKRIKLIFFFFNHCNVFRPPMPPKPKATTTRAAFEAKVLDWSKRLWSAVSKEAKYSEVHDDLFLEFNELQDDARALDTSAVMLKHAAPIYNHISSQGYKPHIHYRPLKDAVLNYCEKKPVADWKGPTKEFSRSPSPPKIGSKSNAGPTKKKGKKAVVSENYVRSDDESEKESAKPREGESAKLRKPPTLEILPTTDGMELSPTKCALCDQRGHACHVNAKIKSPAACFECNHWRLKCSLAPPRTKKGEAADHNEDDVAAPKEQGPKRRKKPTQVPAGQPGQFSGEDF
jgi:hypothetical protein